MHGPFAIHAQSARDRPDGKCLRGRQLCNCPAKPGDCKKGRGIECGAVARQDTTPMQTAVPGLNRESGLRMSHRRLCYPENAITSQLSTGLPLLATLAWSYSTLVAFACPTSLERSYSSHGESEHFRPPARSTRYKPADRGASGRGTSAAWRKGSLSRLERHPGEASS